MLEKIVKQLLEGATLSDVDAEEAMNTILENPIPSQVAAFLTALKVRGETPAEVAGMVRALNKRAIPIHCYKPALDIVGTGGDLFNTINISTGAAILVAACGVPIAKHGNRAVSSNCGSADVLEALGVHIDMPAGMVVQSIKEVGIGFMLALRYHPSFREIAPIRRSLKMTTVFNILGPLINPALTDYALIGVLDEKTMNLIANVLLLLGNRKRALVFYGNGVDELTPLCPSHALEMTNGKIIEHRIDPRDYGFKKCELIDLQGGVPLYNAKLLRDAFEGKKGPLADSLILTAGFGLWIYGKASTPAEGIAMARDTLSSGAVNKLLDKWIKFSRGACLLNSGDPEYSHPLSNEKPIGYLFDYKFKTAYSRQVAEQKGSYHIPNEFSGYHTHGTPVEINKINYLEKMLREKRIQLEMLKKEVNDRADHPLSLILNSLKKQSPGLFKKALADDHELSIIAEIKRRSPSKGMIKKISDPIALSHEYCRGGASAISVLTDFAKFGGSLDELKNVTASIKTAYPEIATLKKDFIIHPLQLAQAVEAGAHAVLLIVAALGETIHLFIEQAAQLGLETLVEIHTPNELHLALEAGATIIGVNHRNLKTFETNLDLGKNLRPLIPSYVVTVAESGMKNERDAKTMKDLGFNAILVGESLMRSKDPANLIRKMKG
jgi:anthranilate phosphoribosyltransferase